MNSARNCSKRKQALDRDRPSSENSVRDSDGANGRLHRRDAASVSGQANRGKKGIPAGGSQGGESARQQRHPHLQATSGSI